jgi:formylglycine-generating enzyme required for sulfatase activity/predicted Ser/Thr protein kinase
MSSLGERIQKFRDGALPREELFSSVERELAEHRTPPEVLLQQLNSEHAKAPLPKELHGELAKRISRWLSDHTMIRPASPAMDDRTILKAKDTSETELLPLRPNADGTTPSTDVPIQPRMHVKVGSILLSRFKLMEQVGVGGMSRVYKAIDLRKVEARSPDPYLAVKVLTVAFSDYFGSIAVLHREADKLQTLTHPNIVRVIDCDRDGQSVFMTMEYLDGVALKSTIQAPTFTGMSQSEAVPLIERIALALAFAHKKGIVHGDLKPGNVIITKAGEVKVIDFGIARFLAKTKDGDPPEEWEQPHALTPSYASPEMMEAREPDPRDDVYALACMAHEVLTGVHPFARESATAARDAGLKAIRHARLTHRQFKAILGGLDFDRQKRTASVERFIDEFRGVEGRGRKRAAIAASIFAVAVLAAGFAFSPWFGSNAKKTSATPGTVFRDCPTCPLMRVLPAGQFKQGSPSEALDGLDFERPAHDVTIGAPFAAGVNEVTIGEFTDFIEATQREMHGCAVYDGEWQLHTELNWRTALPGQTAAHPVTCVSWDDATAYALWLSQQTDQRYRLPSASEWEYAARAETTNVQPRRDESTVCRLANVADRSAAERYPGWSVAGCADGFVAASPVGSFSANSFGLRDMLGNAFEWVDDCWYDTYHGAPIDGVARKQASCTEHEARGGSWFTPPQFVRVAYRNRFATQYRASSLGFRVVREIHP